MGFTADGSINIEVLYAHENIWLSQKRMAELFGCTADNISLHLKNIYTEKELDEKSTTEEFSVVQKEGSREATRKITCYSLEAIIAVGYRVNSERGTQFRQWAITILQEYIHKGFAIDSDRFKYGSRFITRFFDGLLEILLSLTPQLSPIKLYLRLNHFPDDPHILWPGISGSYFKLSGF